MAHPQIVATRQATAYQRIVEAAGKLRDRHDVGDQVDALANATNRDPAFKQMLQSEALADLLEALGKDKPRAASKAKEVPAAVEVEKAQPPAGKAAPSVVPRRESRRET